MPTTFDFDSAWAEQQLEPFIWRVHGDVEVEMPGCRPAGLVLHLWRVRQDRGAEAELSRVELYVAAEMLFGLEPLGRLLADREFSDEKLQGAVRAVLAEYARREVANDSPKAPVAPGSGGLTT